MPTCYPGLSSFIVIVPFVCGGQAIELIMVSLSGPDFVVFRSPKASYPPHVPKMTSEVVQAF
ncbi:hypothetical protein BDV29DRAFT_182232 [Aspergillus leporis]|uniref:Uncharacterized protein n=1 Tax=Aspergillus leporis TaxID=41062 RepID=A0A5N5WMF5_9EURO|nr:hypothetical protein BDV29DRAFT_182232 [Aspergillus leporis]